MSEQNKTLCANAFQIGDPIADSPVGAGVFTDITDAGYPRVNRIAVAWMRRTDGAQYDPHNKVGGTHGPTAAKQGDDM